MAPLVTLNLGPQGPLLVAQNRPVADHARRMGRTGHGKVNFPETVLSGEALGTLRPVLLQPLWPEAAVSPS